MKVKFITSANVTVASIHTELSPKIVKTVKGYKPAAFKIFDEEGKKLTFAVGTDKVQSYSKEILNFKEVGKDETYTYVKVLENATKEEKDACKVELVALSKNIKVVEKQVLAAYKQYENEAASIEEINADEQPQVVVEGRGKK